ncbi:MAG TPA: ATP-binding protein [Candidatus Altiarchaeales archaeon]|nr:ATP-binding protein [Candidatus Altiarchaeales archaeon]
MERAGLVVESGGTQCTIKVTSDAVETGSILKLGKAFGIVTGMRFSEDEKVGGRHTLTAEVQVFGETTGKGIKGIKKPLEPYTKAYPASVGELEGLLDCLDKISFGKVHGTDARAFVNGGEYDRHTAILASTGAGKSFLTANLIKEYSLKGLPILIVDTHGEFQKLLKQMDVGDSVIDVHTVGRQRQGMEMFTIPVSTLSCHDFTHFTSLNENQVHALDMVLNKVYNTKGDKYSMDDVLSACDELAEEAEDNSKKIHVETANALGRRLKGMARSFKNIFTVDGTDINSLVEPYKITIIDTSLSTQGVRQSVVSYISKKLLDGRINKKHSLEGETVDNVVLFVVEEAHNYGGASLDHSCKRQLQRIASEGRKFGVGLLVVSQKPSKIDEEILSQCNTGIYMHITNPRDKDHIRRSFESISDDIIKELDSLDVGECIITGAMVKLPFLLCTVDKINMPDKKESKLNFKKPEKIKTAGFDY